MAPRLFCRMRRAFPCRRRIRSLTLQSARPAPILMHTAVFSIVLPHYRHYATVLVASVERNHPEWGRFVLVVGETSASDRDEELFRLPFARRTQPDFGARIDHRLPSPLPRAG